MYVPGSGVDPVSCGTNDALYGRGVSPIFVRHAFDRG